jgi:CCR4-NOT transcriptional complex subunit CAF120
MNEGGGQVLNNVLSISTAANNRYLLHFNSLNSLTQWTAGIRLSLYEHTTLQEAYTGSLIAGKGKMLNNIRAIMDRTRFKYEDWARVRFGAGTPWRRCWFVITPPDEKEYQKMQKIWKKKTPYEKMPVLKGDLKFYDSKKISKKTRPIATITDAWSAYAVYPQSKPLIDQSTLVKVEGRITIHSNPESSADGFVFVMPEVHPAVTGFEIMLRFLFPVWDVFALYGRPNKLIADTLDSRGLMFAMPKDRRYGYLDILDVSGLIHTDGSPAWTERRWRKALKDLTSERMATAADGDTPNRRSSSRRKTGSRTSLPPTRSGTLRFNESASGSNTPNQGLEPSGTPSRSSFSSLSHRRSASEALGFRPGQRQAPAHLAELNSADDNDPSPPRPPPHRTAFAQAVAPENYESASEGRGSPEADGKFAQSQNAVPNMRTLRSPEPVAPPPSFAHAPSSRPPTQPNQAPELRRGHSGLDNATISQMAEANRMQNTQAGAMQQPYETYNFDNNKGQGPNGYPNEHSGAVGDARSQRGVTQGMNADAQREGPLNARSGYPTTRLATIPASPYIPQGEPASPSQARPTNTAPSQFPLHSQPPPLITTDVQRTQEYNPSTSSPSSQYTPQSPAGGAVEAGQPGGLTRSTSNFSINRKPLPRSSFEQTTLAESQSNREDVSQSQHMASDLPESAFLRDPSPERPRMGKKKTVGSVDLTKQDIVIGDAHFGTIHKPASSNDDLPKIDFGPTYRLDPTKKTGPPSGGASAGASPSASTSVTPQTESPPAAPDNRSTSSLGNRPRHTPTGSQSRLPLRPTYAHNHTPSVESLTKQKMSTSGRTTPSGFGRVTPSGSDREQQHVETLKRVEALSDEIAAVELRPIEMDPVQYDGQTLPRVLVYFLQQFRPRGPQIALDDPRERQERSRILAISKQVHQRYDEEQRHRRERAARQKAEMPPGPMQPPNRNQAPTGYVDSRLVNQPQQNMQLNPKPQAIPYHNNPNRGPQPGHGQHGGASSNHWQYGRGSSPQPQQSVYGMINPNAGYSQEEALRSGRFGPSPADPPQGRSETPNMYGYG